MMCVDLSEDMYRDGFTNITSCDFSPVVIEKMKEKCSEKKGMKCMDIMTDVMCRGRYGHPSYDIP